MCATLKKEFSKLEEIKFLGHKYLVPSPIEGYLADRYGAAIGGVQGWRDKSQRKHGFP